MDLHVAADDRTGALESAAAIADRAGVPIPVTVWPDLAPAGAAAAVVDLGSRHLAADDAAARAATLPTSGRMVHKVDSILRGNWAVELATRHRRAGAPVLLVPSLPALGRVCIRGEVLVGERRVDDAGDPRGGAVTARPAEALAALGLATQELAELHDVAAWLRSPASVAVADAADDAAIEAIVDRWHSVSGVILAGTSAVVGAAIGRPSRHALHRNVVRPPTLVVCGSLNPAARLQIETAAAAGATVVEQFEPDVLEAMLEGTPVILCTPGVEGPVTGAQAERAAARLVHEAAAVIESGHVGTLIVIGGDTAAALLGESLVVVHGSVRPGTALVESLVVDVPVITRSGGFGGPEALADLLWTAVAR